MIIRGCEYNFGRSVFASSSAVGLSAVSFSAPLQKDAAAIPNAQGGPGPEMSFNIQLSAGFMTPTASYRLRVPPRLCASSECIETEKPQRYAEASAIRVATTYFPTS